MTKETTPDLTRSLEELYLLMLTELDHNATRFWQMLKDCGGYDTAKALICSKRPSGTFLLLDRMKRLDLSVEAWILRSDLRNFFTSETKEQACLRLYEFGFIKPADIQGYLKAIRSNSHS